MEEYAICDNVPKKVFYKRDDFTAANEKLFTKEVESITILASLSKKNVNIDEYADEERKYQEIYFLHVVLRSGDKYGDILGIMHSILPKPSVIVLECLGRINVSTAHKRISKAEKNAHVTLDVQETGFLDIRSG